MAAYTITIPDAADVGITKAREAYNASLPAEIDGAPNPDLKADNAAYVQWVMGNAAKSYCIQYNVTTAAPA